jgi:hypothetical protein
MRGMQTHPFHLPVYVIMRVKSSTQESGGRERKVCIGTNYRGAIKYACGFARVTSVRIHHSETETHEPRRSYYLFHVRALIVN